MTNKIESRIKKAEMELKKAKAISVVYGQLANAFETYYCTAVTDDEGNYVRDEDGCLTYKDTPIEEARLYDYDYDQDVYKMAVKLFKAVMENLADAK